MKPAGPSGAPCFTPAQAHLRPCALIGTCVPFYDARTWHRAGYNRSDHKRGMMATNYATPDVVPKRDTRPACQRLHQAPVYQELNAREQRDVTDLLMKVPEFVAS